MSVNSVATGSAGYTLAEQESLFEPVGKSEMDQKDFMNLFITQLQYQDPMKPMDTNEMAAQLAQFSNMDAMLKMSNSVDKLLEYQMSESNLQLLTLLDKDVQVLGNTVGVNDGVAGNGEYVLPQETDTCVIEIYDAGEHLIKVIDMGPMSAGEYDLDWDGLDMQDEAVEDGAYTYFVKAYDQAGQRLDVEYSVMGKVTGIEFDSGAALLTLDKHVSADVGSVVSVL